MLAILRNTGISKRDFKLKALFRSEAWSEEDEVSALTRILTYGEAFNDRLHEVEADYKSAGKTPEEVAWSTFNPEETAPQYASNWKVVFWEEAFPGFKEVLTINGLRYYLRSEADAAEILQGWHVLLARESEVGCPSGLRAYQRVSSLPKDLWERLDIWVAHIGQTQ